MIAGDQAGLDDGQTAAAAKSDADTFFDRVSVCADCAKHPELRELVTSALARGACGVCGSAPKQVFDPNGFHEARDLIRALIRLHINEERYNSHWGGSSLSAVLLDEPNPIFEPLKNDIYADALIHRIESDDDDGPDGPGIALWAGHDADGLRNLSFSIPEICPAALRDIRRRLESENFHAVEGAMRDIVIALENEIEASVAADTLWFRARIGDEDHSLHFGGGKVTRISVPYREAAIGALSPPRANAGRMNRQGVSVLYVASDAKTAMAEIRPHPSHHLSVGGFRPTRPLRIANFNLSIAPFSASDDRLDTFTMIYHIDRLLSVPIAPEDRHRYAATQLLADILIRRGFDGVTYRSSIERGTNLCAFSPANFVYDDTVAAVHRVDRLDYNFVPVSTTIEMARATPGPPAD